MKISVLGIDLAKNVFQLHGVDENGRTMLRKRVRRGELMVVVSQLHPCLIGMEACGGAHYWARRFQNVGHTVRLMPAQYVKAYVKTNKNDYADAEAISEAVTRPSMRFVEIKSEEQQEIQALHRIRERLVKARTALANEIRGFLAEFGVVLKQGRKYLVGNLGVILEEQKEKFSSKMFQTLLQLGPELKELSRRVDGYDRELEKLGKTHPVCQRLQEIPGVGPITASAIIATVGNPRAFKNGRHFSAYLGLVPRQSSSGGKDRLLGISKRGNGYLRKLLIHGARSALRTVGRRNDRQSAWAKCLVARRGVNRTTVAIANKNARIIWALLTSDQRYKATPLTNSL